MTLFTLCVAPMALMAQKITVAQPTIDCGQVQYRRPVTVQFEARNQSGRPITIAKVRSSCGCTVASYPSQAIANGKTFKVSAVYDARQLGHFQKELALYVDGGNKPVYLTLRGVVVEEVIDYTGDFPLELGDLRVDKTDVEYDDVNRGERPFFRINILNPTSKAVSPQVMHLPNYLEAQVSPSTIAAGRPGVVTLTLCQTSCATSDSPRPPSTWAAIPVSASLPTRPSRCRRCCCPRLRISPTPPVSMPPR